MRAKSTQTSDLGQGERPHTGEVLISDKGRGSGTEKMTPDSRRKAIALALAVGAGLLLLVSYLLSSIVLTFVGLGVGLWCVISLFATKSSIVPVELFVSSSVESAKLFRNDVAQLGYNGKAVFLYPKSFEGMKQGYVYISKFQDEQNSEQLGQNRASVRWHEGALLTAPSENIVDLFERRLETNFLGRDINFLRENLPKLMVQDFRIADLVSIEENGKRFDVTIGGKTCANICSEIDRNLGQSNHYACPVCSAFALMLSKVTGHPVSIVKSEISLSKVRTTYESLK